MQTEPSPLQAARTRSRRRRYHPYERTAGSETPARESDHAAPAIESDQAPSPSALVLASPSPTLVPRTGAPPPVDQMRSTAEYSPCKRYRYYLRRTWDDSMPTCAFLMLNPSTATEHANDPTIRRVIGFCYAWGYGSVVIGNTYAFRATDPRELLRVSDAVGPQNDDTVRRIVAEASFVVVAWGNHGASRGSALLDIVRLAGKVPHAFRLTGRGQPEHPLYQPSKRVPVPLLEELQPTPTAPTPTPAHALES